MLTCLCRVVTLAPEVTVEVTLAREVTVAKVDPVTNLGEVQVGVS